MRTYTLQAMRALCREQKTRSAHLHKLRLYVRSAKPKKPKGAMTDTQSVSLCHSGLADGFSICKKGIGDVPQLDGICYAGICTDKFDSS